MEFVVPSLAYPKNALAPHIAERTVEIHYEKHHKGYMKKLDAALTDDPKQREQSLEQIIKTSTGGVFNCAAQVWNHTFYWNSLSPEPSRPSAALSAAIDKDFGSISELQKQLQSVASAQFGSGWGWLIRNSSGALEVTSTTDAENPLSADVVPLLTIDVWEHAYYLDYQNERDRYLDAVIEHLLNWEFASNNFAAS